MCLGEFLWGSGRVLVYQHNSLIKIVCSVEKYFPQQPVFIAEVRINCTYSYVGTARNFLSVRFCDPLLGEQLLCHPHYRLARLSLPGLSLIMGMR